MNLKQSIKTILVLIVFLLSLWTLAAQDRGIKVVAAENLGAQAQVGRQYALFIAIDGYRTWPALKKPVADAREIRDILREQYYIDEFIELYNADATRANIARTFIELQGKLNTHDSLFIYYAGHGYLDKASQQGFWIPVNAGLDEYEQENWLPNSQIRGYISQLKTIHVFMVSDACFSGDILNPNRARPATIDNAYYRNAYSLVSRQVLTSGSSEVVPDESEVSQALKMSFRKNSEPLLDPLGIYNDVRLSVVETTPLLGNLTQASHQDGATFIFFRRPDQTAPPPSSPVSGTLSVGNVAVTSEIAGRVIIDGADTGMTVKAGGAATIQNVATGSTEVAVRSADGQVHRTTPVMVRQGQTVAAVVERPVPDGFVKIQGGVFMMGSPESEAERGSDEVQHQVTITGFYMGRYEVTQAEYEAVMGTNQSYFKGSNLPMEYVAWFEAVEYCNKRSVKEGLIPAYIISDRMVTWNRSANGYRLPTEAEWEYACRAGTTTPFSTGSNITMDQANCIGYNNNAEGTYREKTTAVGSFAANSWGLYDMHGNVWEWCWDWYGDYGTAAQTDPVGAVSGEDRVLRGGSWGEWGVRSAYRNRYTPFSQVIVSGFRLVRP